MDTQRKTKRRLARKRRVRARITGTASRPRLSVSRSNTKVTAQLINDDNAVTICSASSLNMKGGSPLEKSTELGKEIAKLAKKKGVETVIFDRNGLLYHGNVKAVADGAREEGLKF